ncbi:PHA/PHB synthase family protein [Rhodococcus oxybenzonivorans]|uniref:PHA/PHB synthase family protein n=1 Tax=Rhodococcus oxybenzonivorans TaxID=1990687 RepID=UPI00194EA97D|nr:alpha/beta fold hydrolase [Rhodococcus oxybenzonivorans]
MGTDDSPPAARFVAQPRAGRDPAPQRLPNEPDADQEILVDSVRGANPFVGLTLGQVTSAGARWVGALIKRPKVVAGSVQSWAAEEARVLAGRSAVTPHPRDRRFEDRVWADSPVWKRVAQTYVLTRDAVLGSVDRLDLDEKSAERAKFALMQVIEAAAPTNNLLLNPVAQRTMIETRGQSLVAGGRHFLHDVRHNGGMPSQVDTRPFELGVNTAATPGAVVYRSPMFELIQYSPGASHVRSVPTVLIPPQINRYYFLDLAPGRSFVEYAVSQGLQIFCISWRNPTSRQRDWDLDDYAAACIEAMRIAGNITGSRSVNIAGFCAGGMTTSSVLSHLAMIEPDLVNAATLGVTLVDTDVNSTLNMFASERTVEAALRRSRHRGVLSGDSLAKMFAFVRPNDLIWNYVVSNYLLGQNPPAFDVLAWNSDATNMPAALHATFLDMWLNNALVDAGRASVLGTPIDLGKVKNDMYVVGARTDHLVPWESAFAATRHFGGAVRFVLSNSGHIQALINPPGSPKATYYANGAPAPDPEVWLQGAQRHDGSWWEDWAAWSQERSGDVTDPPKALGNHAYPPRMDAPGRYVTE